MGTTLLLALIFGLTVFGLSFYTIRKQAIEETKKGEKPEFSMFIPIAFGIGTFLGTLFIGWVTG
jgi:uncharacterized membrane protein YfcA